MSLYCYPNMMLLFSHSAVPDFATPDCSTPGFPVLHRLLELAQTHAHWVADAIQPSHPLSSPPPPAFSLSQHQGFSNESVLHIRWPKVLELQIQHQSFQWIFKVDFQGTLKSLFQHHSSKASVLRCSAFFMVHFSHPYMTTGKTIACRQSNVSAF